MWMATQNHTSPENHRKKAKKQTSEKQKNSKNEMQGKWWDILTSACQGRLFSPPFRINYATACSTLKRHDSVICLSIKTILKTVRVGLGSQYLVTRTRFESRCEKWWLDSSHIFHRMTRLDSIHSHWLEIRVRFIFQKSMSPCWTIPLRLHTKKRGFFASVMIKIGANFLFCLSSRSMLHFKDCVFPTCMEVDLRLCFHWDVSKAQ